LTGCGDAPSIATNASKEAAMATVDDLIERWSVDEQFRDDFRANPTAAVEAADGTLSDEEWEALRNLDLAGLSDEELKQRVSRAGC
jgi:hypothetical protein